MNSLRAWEIHRLSDDPEQALRIASCPPSPPPRSGEVVVDVRAVALGFPDLLVSQGNYHEKPRLPCIPGGEGVGTVVAVGDSVPREMIGGRYLLTRDGPARGLLRQQVTLHVGEVLPISDVMPDAVAASLFIAYQTAFMALTRRRKGDLRAGETLLVHGAAGGVGSAAVELGKAFGARVIAVVRGAEKMAAALRSGADAVVDSASGSIVDRVLAETDGRGADVVFDPVGGPALQASMRCIAVEGRILVVGFASGERLPVPTNHALVKNYSVIGFRTRPFRLDEAYRRQVHDQLVALYAQGLIRPSCQLIGFNDVPKGLRQLQDRAVTGRLVVDMTEGRFAGDA
ncbi:NADPH:quinone oxidoreductase family protein [Nocardia sp. CA-120079]|uniref:NADPH:quinone oxidoreductase family protein n=1 Tax=Nocardia sp. CA-120079 TaxID=3239974 RepID=UPI003D95D696